MVLDRFVRRFAVWLVAGVATLETVGNAGLALMHRQTADFFFLMLVAAVIAVSAVLLERLKPEGGE